MTIRLRQRVVLFLVLLVGVLHGCKEEDKHAAIENALLRDALITYRLPMLEAQKTQRTVELMEQVDLSGVPPDFAEAYRAHIQAWRQSADAEADGGESGDTRRADASKAFSSTFNAIKVLAAKYGAQLPPGDLRSPGQLAEEALVKLTKADSPDNRPKQWVKLGVNNQGCEWSYQTPVKRVADGVRFWSKSDCPSTMTEEMDGKPFDWRRAGYRSYISCDDERLFNEYVEYFDESGNQTARKESKILGISVDGPEMASQGMGGEVLGQSSLLRKVYEAYCSK